MNDQVVSKPLQDKRVLVTGGASGIGAAIAEKFVNEGARVHICDIDQAALDDFGARHKSVTASNTDLSDPSAINSLFDDADQHLGGLDILVNNAGTSGPAAPAEDISIEDWRSCFAVNVDATFLCSTLALRRMRNVGGGVITNLASGIVLQACSYRAPYGAAKWAIVGLTKMLAAEFASSHVRVNAVAPGAVEGDRIERVIAMEAAAAKRPADDVRAEMEKESAITGFSKPADIAEAVYWLSTPSASRISGHLLPVDGYTV